MLSPGRGVPPGTERGERGVLRRQAVSLRHDQPGFGRRTRAADQLGELPPGDRAADHQARHGGVAPAGPPNGDDAGDDEQGIDHLRFGESADRVRERDAGAGSSGPDLIEGLLISTRQTAVSRGPGGEHRQRSERHHGTGKPPPGRQRHALSPRRAASRARYGIAAIRAFSASP